MLFPTERFIMVIVIIIMYMRRAFKKYIVMEEKRLRNSKKTILSRNDFFIQKMETEIFVPDVITLKGDSSERSIRLENCNSQNDVMEYLKICLLLFSESTNREHPLSQNNRSYLLAVP
jgi:hypothetical protein